MTKKDAKPSPRAGGSKMVPTTERIVPSFEVCRVGDGDAAQFKIRKAKGKIIKIAGHNTSVMLSAYPFLMEPESAPIGTVAAKIVSDDFISKDAFPLILSADPCLATDPAVSLVVHHVFTPTAGGQQQVLCEIVTYSVATGDLVCPIAACA